MLSKAYKKTYWRVYRKSQEKRNFGKKNNPFFLKPKILKEISEAITKSKRTISSALDLYQHVAFIVPTVIVEHIKDQEARDASVALSRTCTIVFQKTIATSELRELDKHVWCWLGTIVKHADLGHISGKIFTINQHYLRHLKEIIIAIGPP
ncbi:hypothetical protein INT45_011542 [Circinella minor]|uniref:Uncharacterized protein n=1 Tax=Circinella minor TaxID=1195481 RepID=A0A8H7S5S7_9FUNG|nr:hypothetical protein INT45_011542 [Circinella minor]